VPGIEYRQIGVRLWGQGAYEREPLDGGGTKYRLLNRVEPGDIIVNKIWARNGSVSVVDEPLAGCYCSGEFPLFRPINGRLEPRWFYWISKTRWFWDRCDVQSRGTSGKNRIRPEKFLAIPIPLPPLPEQRRIVAKVEELAAKIEGTVSLVRAAAAESEVLLPAHLNDLFGNPYANMSGRLGIAKWAAIANLSTDVADGPHITPTYVDGGVPFVTVLNITSGRVKFCDHKYITRESHELYCQRAKAEQGDVLISKDGTIGIPCYIDTEREFSFFVSVALVKPRQNELDGQFLTWALRAPYLQERMRERSRGDMIRHLVLREIRTLLIPHPPLGEQRRIVAYLDDLQARGDSLKALQAQSQAELDALLPSILDKAFKGEL
jgi:type I restriction enzyme S subunit